MRIEKSLLLLTAIASIVQAHQEGTKLLNFNIKSNLTDDYRIKCDSTTDTSLTCDIKIEDPLTKEGTIIGNIVIRNENEIPVFTCINTNNIKATLWQHVKKQNKFYLQDNKIPPLKQYKQCPKATMRYR